MIEKKLSKVESAKYYTALLYSAIEVTSIKFGSKMFGRVPRAQFKVPWAETHCVLLRTWMAMGGALKNQYLENHYQITRAILISNFLYCLFTREVFDCRHCMHEVCDLQ